MNTMAILQLIVGILLISEVCARIFHDTHLTVYYYLCRPFFLTMPMMLAMIVTFMETVSGTLLTFHGLLMLVHQ